MDMNTEQNIAAHLTNSTTLIAYRRVSADTDELVIVVAGFDGARYSCVIDEITGDKRDTQTLPMPKAKDAEWLTYHMAERIGVERRKDS
jgi:hypothetical protein